MKRHLQSLCWRHDAADPRARKFFEVAGPDAGSGDLIVKAINLGSDAVLAQVKLNGLRPISDDAEMTV